MQQTLQVLYPKILNEENKDSSSEKKEPMVLLALSKPHCLTTAQSKHIQWSSLAITQRPIYEHKLGNPGRCEGRRVEFYSHQFCCQELINKSFAIIHYVDHKFV